MRVARCLKSGFAGEPNGQGRAGASPSASDRGRVPGTETGIATTFFNSKAKNLAFALPQSKAMRQNRCSNLSAVIASPYEMRADHEGRRRDLFLSGPIFCFFRNSALYSLGCLTSEKSMTPGRTLRTGPARRVDPCNPLKTLKTKEKIFGEIWRSLQIPCNYLLWDSIKSKA